MKKTLVRFSSLVLSFAMVLGLFPMNAFAQDEVVSDPVVEVVEDGTALDENVVETPVEDEAEVEDDSEELSDETLDESSVEAAGWFDDDTVFATGKKPENGTTTDQPFKSNTAGSKYFRIPAMVTLDSGRIVAAADARWNHTGDAAGLDTLVSYSDDNGKNWHYTMANYLGDNGNVMNKASTAFIDPALATDGKDVWMLVDLFPGGRGLNSSEAAPKGEMAFDKSGNVLLKKQKESGYNYHLKDNGNGYSIVKNGGSAVSGVSVDSYFNIVKNGEVTGNIFFKNAEYQVVPTTFLYLTKSSDGGETWQAPKLLNVKGAKEQFLGVGPGRGLVTSTGRIIFPVYTWPTERTAFIYSDDQGQTWNRSNTMPDVSSEAALVEGNKGELYTFTRHGQAYRSTNNGSDWYLNGVKVPGTMNKGTQISAITYSKKLNGKTAILLSAPTGNTRANGKIFVGLIDDNNGNVTWNKGMSVTTGGFSYSCLTELSDGSIALLYEPSGGKIEFRTFPISKVASGMKVEDSKPQPEPEKDVTVADKTTNVSVTAPGLKDVKVSKVNATVAEGYSKAVAYDITLNGGKYTGAAVVKVPVDATLKNCLEFTGHVDGEEFVVENPVNGYFTLNVPHFSTVTISGKEKAAEPVVPTTEKNITLDFGGKVTETQLGLSTELTSVDVQDSNSGIVNTIISSKENKPSATTTLIRGNQIGLNSMVPGDSMQVVIASGNNMMLTNGNSAPLPGIDGKLENNQVFTITYKGNSTYEIKNCGLSGDRISGYNVVFDGKGTLVWTLKEDMFQQTKSRLISGDHIYGLTLNKNSWEAPQDGQGSHIQVYEVIKQQPSGQSTWDYTITFEAQKAGTTTVVFGNTTYNITVNYKKEVLNVPLNGSVTIPSGEIIKFPNPNIAKAQPAGNGITVTGVAEGDTTMIVGDTEYTVKVSSVRTDLTIKTTPFVGGSGNLYYPSGEDPSNDAIGKRQPITKLTVSKNMSYDLDLRISGKNVVWASDDESIVKVDQNGTVTGMGPKFPNKQESTFISATVNGVTYKIPVSVVNFTKGKNKHPKEVQVYDFYTKEIANTEVWYAWDCLKGQNNEPEDFIKLQEGEAIYVAYPNNISNCCDFFAKPNAGHALTGMTASGSYGHYEPIRNPNGTFSDSWLQNGKAGYFQENNDAWRGYVKPMLKDAYKKLRCDGVMGFTRGKNDKKAVSGELTFVSEKLPTIDKVVHGILPNGTNSKDDYRPYVPGMTASVGDKVYYRITVTQYKYVDPKRYSEQDPLDYRKIMLKDTMTDDLNRSNLKVELFKGDGIGNVGKKLSNPVDINKYFDKDGRNLKENKTYTYYAVHTVTNEDLDHKLINTVTLDSTYDSRYSHGEYLGKAEAVAEILATKFAAKDIVVDFGLPVTVHINKFGKDVDLVSGTATYGDVTIANVADGWDVTYTPNKVLLGRDSVELLGDNDKTYSFNVYPATNVYYEEGFAIFSGSKGNSNQTTSSFGDSNSHYGYDVSYSNGDTTSSLVAPRGTVNTFEFKGSGIDLYVNTTSNSGVLKVLITEKATGVNCKMAFVDTHHEWEKAPQQLNGTKNAPVYTCRDLDPSKEYIVRMFSEKSDVQFDGFRVYETLTNQEVANGYAVDKEANPRMVEVRDVVMANATIDPNELSPWHVYKTTNTIIKQVKNDQNNGGPGQALVISQEKGNSEIKVDADFVDKGPKNELYLQPGSTLVLKLDKYNASTQQVVVGMRTIDGTKVDAKINGNSTPITSSVDMFYRVEPESDGLIRITNTSKNGGLLSITNLKVSDNVRADNSQPVELAPLKERELRKVLKSIR